MKPHTAFLVLGTLTLGGGCAKPAAPERTAVSAAHWRMTLTCAPTPPRQLDPTQMQVQITDGTGKPVNGAAVTLALAMPTMDMGRNGVVAVAGAPGVYTGTGRFTMPGDWSVTVRAAKDSWQQTQSFPITVR